MDAIHKYSCYFLIGNASHDLIGYSVRLSQFDIIRKDNFDFWK